MSDAGMLSTSDPLMASLQALPVGVHMVLGSGMAAGLVLWLAGAKVARPMFALIGVVFGASIGFFLAPILATEPIHNIPTPYLGLGVGALIGLSMSVALFRFTMAIAAAIVLALAGMVGTSVYLDHTNPAPQAEAAPRSDTVQAKAPTQDDIRSRLGSALADRAAALGAPEGSPEWARQAAEHTREFLDRAGEATRDRWEQVPGEHRLMVAGGGVGGALFGFMLGVFVPRRAAALVTALFGSALWLSCAAWVADATGAPGLAVLNQPKEVWLEIWPATASLGVLIQWISVVRARKATG